MIHLGRAAQPSQRRNLVVGDVLTTAVPLDLAEKVAK
jgi:hypothetical protein